MKIEKGKFYRLENGQKVEIYAVHEKQGVIHGVLYASNFGVSFMAWALDGTPFCHFSDHAIKEEWGEKHPAEDWPKGRIVEVSNDKQTWYLRRFEGVRPGTPNPIQTLCDGYLAREKWLYARIPEEIRK